MKQDREEFARSNFNELKLFRNDGNSESFKRLSTVLDHYCGEIQAHKVLHLLLRKAIVFSLNEKETLS